MTTTTPLTSLSTLDLNKRLRDLEGQHMMRTPEYRRVMEHLNERYLAR